LTHYFSVTDTEEVYPRLATQPSERWQASWQKHSASYQKMLDRNRERLIASGALPAQTPATPPADPSSDPTGATTTAPGSGPPENVRLPGFFSQFATLLSRRWRIFFRDRGQVFLQLAILICFPILVTLFSNKASGNIRNFDENHTGDLIREKQNEANVRADQAKVGSAVSGIIMFQVVLLSLMGSNNSAREIAGERPIYEKEKFGGLRPSAYLGSKIAFLACLVIMQSLWMAFFVNFRWSFRGDFVHHAGFLLLVNAAMTSICLAISALMRTAEQASLLSIYLVGFQLPLSGAVLALPENIEAVTRPFISAYWAWSGSVEALEAKVHDSVKSVIDTGLSVQNACLYALGAHILVALIAAWAGACRPQWD